MYFRVGYFIIKKLAKLKITFEQKCSLAPLLAGWLCPKWSDKVVQYYNVASTGLKKNDKLVVVFDTRVIAP